MFSWFKAKTPVTGAKWEILKNGYGEFFVRRVPTYTGRIPRIYSEDFHFAKLKFGNEIQAESAIKEWETKQELKKETHVKYL